MSTKGRRDNLTYLGVMHNAVVAMRKAGGVSSDLFHLAKKADSQDAWEAQCDTAEEWVLSDEAGEMKCHELPGCWSQARSDVRGGFRAGLDFSKIPSYHKMKIAKAEANGAKREAKQQQQAPAEDAVEVVVVVDDAGEAKPKLRHVSDGRDARGPRVDTLQAALADGSVIDAKTNLICPPELAPLVAALSKLDEMSRNRMIKRFTKEALNAHSTNQQRMKSGEQAVKVVG